MITAVVPPAEPTINAVFLRLLLPDVLPSMAVKINSKKLVLPSLLKSPPFFVRPAVKIKPNTKAPEASPIVEAGLFFNCNFLIELTGIFREVFFEYLLVELIIIAESVLLTK